MYLTYQEDEVCDITWTIILLRVKKIKNTCNEFLLII